MFPTIRNLLLASVFAQFLAGIALSQAVADYPDQVGNRSDNQEFRVFNPWNTQPGTAADRADRRRTYPAYYSQPYYYRANPYRGYPDRGGSVNVRFGQGEYGLLRPRAYTARDGYRR